MSSIAITFFAYGLTAVVSILVAVLIKFMTTVLSGMQQPKAAAQVQVPASVPAAVTSAASETDIAVIAAAVYAAMGDAVRIVRIDGTGRGVLWVASGRFVHQKPHVLTSRPPYKAM
ncbi:hypothetical protein RIEGSTA812A_PEG_696 [invertebrate metagenome]|uniref:Oxaloacetate decarboxylase gamma chain n=1 Tax=invertebrate metagenome TaxID=1711999 RepID=A0A484H8U7_9ZZZZ